MLQECLDVFQTILDKDGEKIIFDSYTPADGTYVFVKSDGSVVFFDILLDKKTRTVDRSHALFPAACFRDYYSKLADMNKPQDPKKVIHSNNYLTFFVKKESIVSGKLTDEIIDGYYKILSNPAEKHKKSKSAYSLYMDFENEAGPVDENAIHYNKEWIKTHIFSLEEFGLNLTKKDYLKIFFEASADQYEKEGRRYLTPCIYNSNDYNVTAGDKVLGLPNDNVGLNSKKPFLENKTRKVTVPRLLDTKTVLLQKKFFDYLMNFAIRGKNHIYIDLEKKQFRALESGEFPDENFSGIFLRIQKGKELEIHNQDVIPIYSPKLSIPFHYENILNCDIQNLDDIEEQYTSYTKKMDVEKLIDSVLFSKFLRRNYFTDAKDLRITDGVLKRNLLESREAIFEWLYKRSDSSADVWIGSVLDRASDSLIDNTIANGYIWKAKKQFNFRWSMKNYFEGGTGMAGHVVSDRENLRIKINAKEAFDFDNDEEYFFAVGQLTQFFFSLNKSKKKDYSFLNPITNSKSDILIKKKLGQLWTKYNYAIEFSFRFNSMYAAVIGYTPEEKINKDLILMGFLTNSLIYEKKDTKDNTNQGSED